MACRERAADSTFMGPAPCIYTVEEDSLHWETTGGGPVHVPEPGDHLQLHHQPMEPVAAGFQAGSAVRRPREGNARGALVDDAPPGLEISHERGRGGAAGRAQQPRR